METKTAPPIFKIQETYETVGSGPIPKQSCQIGEWWVMTPEIYFEEFNGKIPPHIQKRLFEFLASGVEVQGFLIAEDIEVVEAKRKREEEKKKAQKKAVETGLGAVVTIASGLVIGAVFLLTALCANDPMLICVSKSGEWICIGTWFD